MQKWNKFLALGCSHGQYADPDCLAEILRFKKSFKPNLTMHLGDALDFTAFRSGAKGTKDAGEKVELDLGAGLDFLKQLKPNVYFLGNHEDRINRYIGHPDAIISYAASKVMSEVEQLCRKTKTEIVPYDIDLGWRQFGDTLFGHGYMYNQNAVRDHAETFGKCVFAHLHRTGLEKARQRNGATGYCVGWLGRKQAAGYAKTFRSRLAWNNGYTYGYYNDKYTIVNLVEKHPTAGWLSK